jgi:carboxy-terminal domain RNA polymerase II polypeptide A small phosphatase
MRQLLVLDIDSTLVWSDAMPFPGFDFIITIQDHKFWVKKRPGLDQFLQQVRQDRDIAIWSYAREDYVQAIVSTIIDFPLVFVWSRKRCTEKIIHDEWKGGGLDGQHIVLKKLGKIWRRRQWNNVKNTYTRKNTLILDDTPETYLQNYGNAIPIRAYEGKSNDSEFDRVVDLSENILMYADVRQAYKR